MGGIVVLKRTRGFYRVAMALNLLLFGPGMGFAQIAYIANNGTAGSGPSTVTVINTHNNTVLTTIGVGTRPGTVAVNPTLRTVYVTDEGDPSDGFGSGSVSVISAATNTVTATIPVDTPYGIATFGQRVY